MTKKEERAKILAAISVLQKIHIRRTYPILGVEILVNANQPIEDFYDEKVCSTEAICLTKEVINYLLKEIEDRDQIIHDLRVDSPAYAVTFLKQWANTDRLIYSTSSLLDAKRWAEKESKWAGALHIGIFEGERLAYTLGVINGQFVWTNVKDGGL